MIGHFPAAPLLVDALTVSGTYILLGLSWVIVYRATRVLNIAVGQFMALGAYVLFALSVKAHLPFVIALLVTLAGCAGFAGLSFHFFVRPLHGQPHFVPAVLTIGYSILIGGVIAIIWGQGVYELPGPVPDKVYILPAAIRITTFGVATLVIAVAFVAGLTAFFRYTRMGMQMRAASELPVLASQSGANISVLFFVAWAIAGVAAALAGIAFAYTNEVSPQLSQIALYGLTPALIGGFESIPGTMLGALILAVVQTVGVWFLGGDAQDAVVFGVLLLFLVIRPTGLFGKAEIRRV
jgi:branched-chain amino acid transport system permease protein